MKVGGCQAPDFNSLNAEGTFGLEKVLFGQGQAGLWTLELL